MTRPPFEVTEVHIRLAPPRDRDLGVIGFVSLTIAGGLRLDGLTVRRSRAGDCYVAFPSRQDGRGRERFYSKPIDDETRRSIEAAVLGELVRMQGGASSGREPTARATPGRSSRQPEEVDR